MILWFGLGLFWPEDCAASCTTFQRPHASGKSVQRNECASYLCTGCYIPAAQKLEVSTHESLCPDKGVVVIQCCAPPSMWVGGHKRNRERKTEREWVVLQKSLQKKYPAAGVRKMLAVEIKALMYFVFCGGSVPQLFTVWSHKAAEWIQNNFENFGRQLAVPPLFCLRELPRGYSSGGKSRSHQTYSCRNRRKGKNANWVWVDMQGTTPVYSFLS